MVTPVVAPDEDAQRASAALVLGCVAIVTLFIAAAVGLYLATKNTIVIDTTGFVVLAPIYIVAQAIERLLDPMTSRLKSTVGLKTAVKLAHQNTDAAQKKYDAGVKEKLPSTDLDTLQDALNKVASAELKERAKLRKVRSERSLILWCIATSISVLITAALGLGLIAAISKAGTFPDKEWLHALDIVLTGVAIGAGTKPLHDLISRIEKSKDAADPATKPTSTATT